jgi:hypothetical protein
MTMYGFSSPVPVECTILFLSRFTVPLSALRALGVDMSDLDTGRSQEGWLKHTRIPGIIGEQKNW